MEAKTGRYQKTNTHRQRQVEKSIKIESVKEIRQTTKKQTDIDRQVHRQREKQKKTIKIVSESKTDRHQQTTTQRQAEKKHQSRSNESKTDRPAGKQASRQAAACDPRCVREADQVLGLTGTPIVPALR